MTFRVLLRVLRGQFLGILASLGVGGIGFVVPELSHAFPSAPWSALWATSGIQNVFGENDRKKVEKAIYPLSAIGALFYELESETGTSFCTASLIGEARALTNAHCVVKNGRVAEVSKFVLVFLENDLRVASARVRSITVGTQILKYDWDGDWAILELDQPIGATRGYFDVAPAVTLGKKTETLRVSMAGMGARFHDRGFFTSIDSCLIRGHVGAHPRSPRKQLVLHDCDSSGGDSGSPLYRCPSFLGQGGRCKIVALHVAATEVYGSEDFETYDRYRANWAINSKSFYEKVRTPF